MFRSNLYSLIQLSSLFLILAKARALNVTRFDEESRCPDGSRGIVNHIQKYVETPYQPAIFTVDCGSSAGNSTIPPALEKSISPLSRHKRATTSCTSLDCSTACYGGTDGPTVSDCDALVTYLQHRGQQQSVSSMQAIVVTSNTCLFRFTNLEYGSLTLCDAAWATKSSSLEGQCLPQTPGALCTASGFKLDVCLNPDAPAPAPTTSSVVYAPAPTPAQSKTTTSTANPNTNVNTQSASPVANAASTSSSLSGSGASSASGSHTGVTSITRSLSGTVEVTGYIVLPNYSTDLPPSSATIAQAYGSKDSKNAQSNIPSIVGGIFGALVLIAILVGIWVWRRRMRFQREHDRALNATLASEEPNQTSQHHLDAYQSSSQQNMIDRTPMPMTTGYGGTKLGLAQRSPAPVSEYSTSSVNHLLGGTQETISEPSTPHTGTSLVNHSEYGPVDNARPDFEGRPRSMSARTLAQALAPNLSERDITRLADTIVARMQTGVPIVSPQADVLASGASEVVEDPPPPWRASWNSSNGNTRTPTA